MQAHSQKGFTLIELMVTVAILGLFASVTFVSLGSSRARSRDAVRAGDLKNISLAAEQYFMENGSFPTSMADLDQYFALGASGSTPKDPLNDEGHQYYYSYDENIGKYCVEAMMETVSNDVECGSHEVNYKIIGP